MIDSTHEAAQRLQDRLRASPGAISILVDRDDLEIVVGALLARLAANRAWAQGEVLTEAKPPKRTRGVRSISQNRT